MHDIITNLFGVYTPQTYTVVEYAADGSVLGTYEAIASGVAGVDWVWLAGVILFGIVLYGFLRLLGGVLRG